MLNILFYSTNEVADTNQLTQPVSDETAVDDVDVDDVVTDCTDSAVEDDSNMDDIDVAEPPLLVSTALHIQSIAQDYKKPLGPSGNCLKTI